MIPTHYAGLTIIRDGVPDDIETIRSVVTAAFACAPHASGSEAAIVDALRAKGALTLSLLAEEEGRVVGYVAYSPVSINGKDAGWFGVGPMAVMNSAQRRGIGKALIESGISRLVTLGARGCVVLGDPAYYGRFGFESWCAGAIFPKITAQWARTNCLIEYHSAFY